MSDSLTAPVPEAFSVSVIVEFIETQDSRWESGHWQVTGIVASAAGNRETISSKQLHENAGGKHLLHTGLDVRLYKDDAESYYFNLVSDNPSVFIICSQEDDEPIQPFIATLSYGEATSYMETDEIVETVPMPPEIYRWAERYVLEHYVPEKRKKRKRDNWKETDHGPGKQTRR